MNEKKLIRTASFAADALPVVRALSAPAVANHLEKSPPEDRTWRFCATVASLLATDKIDGLLARYAGPTQYGGFLDQLSDKALFLIPTRKLVELGEISPAHYYIPLARDIGVTAMRSAYKDRIETDARLIGKGKMVTQSAALLVACSPLAAKEYSIGPYNRRLIEDMYSIATASSLISGADFLKSAVKQLNEVPVAELIPFTSKHGELTDSLTGTVVNLFQQGIVQEAENAIENYLVAA